MLAGGYTVNAMLSLAAIAVMGRALGPDGYGELALAMAFGLISLLPADWGVAALCLREHSQNPRLGRTLFASAFVLRLILALGCLGASFAILPNFHYTEGTSRAAMLCAAAAAVGLLADIGRNYFRAEEKMHYECVTIVTERALILVGSVLLAQAGGAVWHFGAAFLAAAVCRLAMSLAMLIPLLHPPFLIEGKSIRFIATEGLPFGLIPLFLFLGARGVVLILERHAALGAIGEFAAAQRLAEGFLTIADAVVAGSTPILAKSFVESQESHRESAGMLLRSGFFLGCAAAGILIPVAPWLLTWVFGPGFSGAEAIMGTLLVGLPLFLGVGVMAAAHNGAHRQRLVARCAFGGTLLTLTLAFVLTPLWQGLGAAISLVAGSGAFLGLMAFRASGMVSAKDFRFCLFCALCGLCGIIAGELLQPLGVMASFLAAGAGFVGGIGALRYTRKTFHRCVKQAERQRKAA
jgi:O-antigen/teichoic acid export membrane protein